MIINLFLSSSDSGYHFYAIILIMQKQLEFEVKRLKDQVKELEREICERTRNYLLQRKGKPHNHHFFEK